MTCPSCGAEAEPGCVEIGVATRWIPVGTETDRAKLGLLMAPRLAALRCPSCRLIWLDYRPGPGDRILLDSE